MPNNTIHSAFTNSIAQGQMQKVSGLAKTNEARANATGKDIQDAAVISSASSLLSASRSTDDVRMDKVAALKTAIGNGTYNIAPAAVADKIIGGLLQ